MSPTAPQPLGREQAYADTWSFVARFGFAVGQRHYRFFDLSDCQRHRRAITKSPDVLAGLGPGGGDFSLRVLPLPNWARCSRTPGGQYVYLREVYGDLVAFLYGWMLFGVGNGGTIAALAVARRHTRARFSGRLAGSHVVFSLLLGMPLTRAHFLPWS